MEERGRTPRDGTKSLRFFAAFFQAVGVLSTLASCGTDYWLLGWESCGDTQRRGSWVNQGDGPPARATSQPQDLDSLRFFHEGLFWRCSFKTRSDHFSLADIWTIFRTFWSIFLVVGVVSIAIGGVVVICAAAQANHKLYKVGGSLQLCGGLCLMAVVVMYITWFQTLGILEHYAAKQRESACPGFHLSVEHGPSFAFAPVAFFFCVLAGLLFVVIGRVTQKSTTLTV